MRHNIKHAANITGPGFRRFHASQRELQSYPKSDNY